MPVPILATNRFAWQARGGAARMQRGAVRAAAATDELDITQMAPLADRILVKPSEAESVTSGGLLLTSAQGSSEDAQFGEVLEVGDKVEIKVAKGDTVIYTKYGTTDVEVADGKVTFVRGDSLLGVCA